MRAYEIIQEDRYVKTNVRLEKEQEQAIPSLHRVAGTADRHYDLNRVMMAAATADGSKPVSIPKQSWAGRNNVAAPYTKLESDMLKQAYQAAGADWDDALKPNRHERSLEPKETNKQSIVPRYRPNRFGI